MKKTTLIIVLSIGLSACGSTSSNNSDTDTSTVTHDTGTTVISKGSDLMAMSDCNTCHKSDIKLIGPSFKDIANKYTEADMNKLVDKVIKGGSGTWGSAAMNPHPALNKDDIKKMVKYILTQK